MGFSRLKEHIVLFLVLVCLSACGKAVKTNDVVVPQFSADSAFRYVSDQVDMGARVPGTTAHYECVLYLQQQLRRFGAEVEIQQGQKPDYKGDMQQVVNIIGHFPGTASKRVLLCAHYDTRPWADQEEDYENRMQPILGANDGASGVGVLLEIARQTGLSPQSERKPVDIVFFDCEDMGTPDFYSGKERENTWCLGSQLWAEQIASQTKGNARTLYKFGILLDMVGAPDAIFPREYYSEQFAQNIVEKVWRSASALGYSSKFVSQQAYPITDDHYYVNTIAQVPCIDIIHYDPYNGTGFAHWWHTAQDDMRNISPATLEAVGKTVLAAIK